MTKDELHEALAAEMTPKSFIINGLRATAYLTAQGKLYGYFIDNQWVTLQLEDDELVEVMTFNEEGTMVERLWYNEDGPQYRQRNGVTVELTY